MANTKRERARQKARQRAYRQLAARHAQEFEMIYSQELVAIGDELSRDRQGNFGRKDQQ